jgi:RHS repeat-associated protein
MRHAFACWRPGALALLGLVSLLGLQTVAQAATSAPQPITPAASAPHAPPDFLRGLPELTSLRARNSRSFQRPDGTRVAEVSRGSLNYQDQNGRWLEIDNTLAADAGPDPGLHNTANRYRLALPGRLDRAPVRVTQGSYWAAFALEGAAAASASADGATARYADAFPGVSAEYTAEPDMVKESLVLASAAAPSSFTYQVSASAGLSATKTAKGGIEFRDGQGTLRMAFAAPFLQDSSGSAAGLRGPVSVTLAPSAGGYELTYAADRGWLMSSARVWPVVLDPTVQFEGYGVVSPGRDDCFIASGVPDNSFCDAAPAGPYDYVGGGGQALRTLLRFDLASNGVTNQLIPQDAQVLEAQLLMLPVPGYSTDSTIEVHRLLESWTVGVTWNKHDGIASWVTPGGTIDPSEPVNPRDWGTLRSDGWMGWQPTGLVSGWVAAPGSNNGLLLKQNDESTARVASFYSGQDPNGNMPALYVWYRSAPIGALPKDAFFTQRLTDRTSASVNLATGNLLLSATDLHIAGTNGLDLSLNRYYNSRADSAGALSFGNLGTRWSTDAGLDVDLLDWGTGDFTFVGPSGYAATFTPSTGTGYIAPPGLNATLTANADGTKTVTFDRTGEVYRFLASGALQSHEDRNGNKIVYGYTNTGQPGNNGSALTSITDTHNRVVTITPDTSNRIGLVTDPGPAPPSSPRYEGYAYDANGNLTIVTAPDDTPTVRDYTAYAYDSVTGELTQITDGAGHITRFTYVSLGTNRGRAVETMTRVNPGPAGDSTWRFDYLLNITSGTCASAGNATTVTDPLSNPTTYCWNAAGMVRKTIDGRGNANTADFNPNFDQTQAVSGTVAITGSVYDSQNRLKEVDGAAGSKLLSTYTDTAVGHAFLPTTFTGAQSLLTNTLYDGPGNVCAFARAPAAAAVRPTSCTDRSQPDTVTIERNVPDGTVKSVTDGRTMKTSYGYTNGDLTSITPPPGSVRTPVSYGYDGLSRVTSYTDGKGQTTGYTYDVLDRVTRITYQGGTHVDLAYDFAGNLRTRSDAALMLTYTPDALNRLVSEAFSDGRTSNSYVYDAAGNLRALTDAGGTVSYHYDAANNADTVTEPGGFLIQSVLSYNADNALQTIQLAGPSGASQPGPVTITRTYTSGRLSEIKAVDNTLPASPVVLTDFVYCFRQPAAGCDGTPGSTVTDMVQRVKDVNRNDTSVFSYLKLDQLTDATVTGTDPATYHYTYDASGNRATRTVGGTLTTYTNDPGNVLQSAAVSGGATTTYTSDAIGNLTDSSAGLHLVYNKANQTTSVTPPGGAATGMTYTGPGQGERLSYGALTFTTNILGVGVQKNGSTTSYYTRLPDGTLLGERVVTGSGTSRYYYLADALGSVARLIDPAGVKKNNYRYDPSGNLLLSTGTVSNPFKFAGEFQDASGFYKIGERYYDPALGRWTQPDPIAAMADYAYAGNNPVNIIDPSGTISITGIIGLGLEVVGTTISCVAAETGIGAAICGAGVGNLILSGANADSSSSTLSGIGFIGTYITSAVSCVTGSLGECGIGLSQIITSGLQLTPKSQRGRRAPVRRR